jgi:DNA invertase Pin-like site-specific DNA recombinase/murein DD-endopeptidase MepM/ murein hydrolase activator NlpD
MLPSAKIQATHRARQAVVYVRQSTPHQLQQHPESTRRQYQLATTAQTLGWPLPRIRVIDEDLGFSGASSTERRGFQWLVTAIGLGEIGLVLVTEVSRLSRLNSDWHRVLELCAVFETLIADEDGIYDPRDPNDRLVLGLKGTLFAAELQILQARMRGALLNKARRGALAVRLPVGYCRQEDGTVVLDPHERVRATLETLFAQFAQLHNARAVQRYFLAQQLEMPRRLHCGPETGQLVWVRPTYLMIHQVLISPVYAGIYVYGRRRELVTPGDPPQRQSHRLPQEEWAIVLPDIYPAYISAAEYQRNQQALAANQYNFAQKHPGAAREGRGLLQGLVVCGRCGQRMTPTYGQRQRGRAYVCRHEQVRYGAARCQAFPQRDLDAAVSAAFLAAMQPAQVELLLEALGRLEAERAARDQHWQLRLEQARYAVRLAQRQYDAVDPEHRLVARELEARWNTALGAYQELERAYAAVQADELRPLSAAEETAVRALAVDLPAVWAAETTSAVERKRLLRLVIAEVRVTAEARTRRARVVIHWSGGLTTEQEVACAPLGWASRTDPQMVERIRELAGQWPDHQIAAALNAEGRATRTGKAWTYGRVASVRHRYGIATACPVEPGAGTARGDGLVPVRLAAARLGISTSLVLVWVAHGVLHGDQREPGSFRWIAVTEADVARLSGAAPSAGLATLEQIAAERGIARQAVWELVRAGEYVAYRVRQGQVWAWRLQASGAGGAGDGRSPTGE